MADTGTQILKIMTDDAEVERLNQVELKAGEIDLIKGRLADPKLSANQRKKCRWVSKSGGWRQDSYLTNCAFSAGRSFQNYSTWYFGSVFFML